MGSTELKDATNLVIFTGIDYWSRASFMGAKSGNRYVDVDGELHTITADDEPYYSTGYATPKVIT